MSTGVVTTITTDWRGDTLAADVDALDETITVDSTIDFDEDGGWLVIGDSDPMQYLSVDEDVSTVTLSAAAGDDYEAGLPVVIWDPTVANGGAQVVEYVATVELHDGTGSPDAVIPHGLIPASSVDFLIGASVRIEQGGDGGWFIEKVLGREATLGDVDIVGARFLTAYEGRRIVIQPFVSGDSSGSTIDFFTDSVHEVVQGQFAAFETDLGGGDYTLGTTMSGPRVDMANYPRISLTSTELGATVASYFTANADHVQFNADSLVLNGDRVESPNLYLTDPPSGAFTENVNINGVNGQLREVTSSERFKQDIEPATIDVAAVREILAVTFRDKGEVESDPDTEVRHLGVIAEQLDELGLREFVTYEADGTTPRGVAYSRLSVACLAVLQDQERRLARIEAALNIDPEGD